MLQHYEIYELNDNARRKHPCINPRCSNFVEIENSYDICMRCFDMLVDYLGSEHLIFDYGTRPALRCMTMKQLKTALRKAEAKFPSVLSIKRGNSNSQMRWHKKRIYQNELTENENLSSSNRQK
jgi:hypothetical protein